MSASLLCRIVELAYSCRRQHTHLLRLGRSSIHRSIRHGLHLQLLRLKVSSKSSGGSQLADLWHSNLEIDIFDRLR